MNVTDHAQRSYVWFVSLSDAPAYGTNAYADLFHLNESGGARFTRSTLPPLSEAIAATSLRSIVRITPGS